MTNVALIRCGDPARSDEMINPPLGLLYLSSYIKRNGCKTLVIDRKIEKADDEILVQSLREFEPDVIGLSGFSTEAARLHETARTLSQAFPRAPVIVGGPHASADPQDVVSDKTVACAVIGEGEETFRQIIESLAAGRTFENVRGIAFKNGKPEAERTEPRAPISPLDDLPFPDWDQIDFRRYAGFHGATPTGRRIYAPVFTSRACPFGCTYCHRIFGKTFRARSPENVMEEIRLLHTRHGIRNIEIADDIFNLDNDRAMRICEAVAEANLGLNLSFPNGLRADLMTPELLRAMKRAGTTFISYAVESGSEEIQKNIRKNIDLEKTRAIISLTVREGIYVNGFFMMGFPGETKAQMQKTIDYARSTRLHSGSFFILVPFAGTDIRREMEKSVPHLHGLDRTDLHTGFMNCSALSNRELIAMKRNAYIDFYFRKARILRTLASHPDKKSLAGLALKVLGRMNLFGSPPAKATFPPREPGRPSGKNVP